MFCLVIRPDPVVYGPFDTQDEAIEYASHHWPDPEDLAHADMNSDFYAATLSDPSGTVIAEAVAELEAVIDDAYPTSTHYITNSRLRALLASVVRR
jgi:hypothetical protein